ncbi:hypothetical protein AB988_4349 [Acinetobacter baumannii]|nr:hypothetical protein AB988_4349 [Acinetobacter baumannii]
MWLLDMMSVVVFYDAMFKFPPELDNALLILADSLKLVS